MTDDDVFFSGGGENQTSSALLDRVKAREPEAWRRFVRLYTPLILWWCRQCGLREEEAADVAQDVFAATVTAIGGFVRKQPGALRAWLRTVTHNKAVDYLRRKPPGGDGVGGSDIQTKLLAVPADGPSGTADEGQDREQDVLILHRRAVELILDECKPGTRQAFLRVVLGGEDPADVARELGMTPNAVYLAKSRILRRVREEFAELADL